MDASRRKTAPGQRWSSASCDCSLELDFRAEAPEVASDGQRRELAAAPPIANRRVAVADATIDLDPVPLPRMADMGQGQIVLPRPKERNRVEPFADAQDIAGRRLALPFGNNPMLDTYSLTGQRVGPAGDVAGGPDAGNTGFQITVDRDAVVDGDSGRFGENGQCPHPDADDDEIGVESLAAMKADTPCVVSRGGPTEMKLDAVLLMDPAYQLADLGPKYGFHRARLGGHDVDVESART